MALGGEREVARGRAYAMTWAVVVYAGMITLGLCARVLLDGLPDAESAFFAVANDRDVDGRIRDVLGWTRYRAYLYGLRRADLVVAQSRSQRDLVIRHRRSHRCRTP